MNYWSLLFVAPLLAYASPSFGAAGFNAHYLLVPLAALVGGRYVLTGVTALALGGLLFVVNVGGTWGAIGGDPGVYLVALAVAGIAASPRPLAEWPRWPSDLQKAGVLAFAAPFLLTLEAGTAYMGVPATGLWFAVRFPLEPLGYFLLFLMGARGVRVQPMLLGLGAAAALGWGLQLLGYLTHLPAAFFVTLEPLKPVPAIAALAVFSAGGAMSAILHGGPLPAPWRRPEMAIAALLLLWFVVPGQSIALLPLAAFMAGLLSGARGVVLVSALAPALMLLWVIAGWLLPAVVNLNAWPGRLPLEAPFVTAAWAVLGARLGQTRPGAERFRLPRYPAYVVLLAAAALALFGGGTPTRLALAGLFVVGGLAIYFAGARLGRAMAKAGHAISADRWVSFTALALLCASVAANWPVIVATLRLYYYRFPLLHAIRFPADAAKVKGFLGASISPELAALLVAFAAVCALALALALASLVSSLPKVVRDARRIADFARQRPARPL